MMTTARKGVPSTQFARELGVTQKTAWFLAHRIRQSWLSSIDTGSNGGNGDMGPVAEVDEAYIGGKEKTSITPSDHRTRHWLRLRAPPAKPMSTRKTASPSR